MDQNKFAEDLAQFLSDEAFDEERVGSDVKQVMIYPDDPNTLYIDLKNGQTFRCVVTEVEK